MTASRAATASRATSITGYASWVSRAAVVFVSVWKTVSTKSTQRAPNMAMPTTAASMKVAASARPLTGRRAWTIFVSPMIISGYIIR